MIAAMPHDHSHDHSHPHSHHNHVNEDHDNSQSRVIEIEKDVLNANHLLAERNRGYFEAKNIITLNLVSSPVQVKQHYWKKLLNI